MFAQTIHPTIETAEQQYAVSLHTHLSMIRKVIGLMEHELIRKNGECGGKINFGDYTAVVPAFFGENGSSWLQNRRKPQQFLSVAGILRQGIKSHHERIDILVKMLRQASITEPEHQLLMQVKALKDDPIIVDYASIKKAVVKIL